MFFQETTQTTRAHLGRRQWQDLDASKLGSILVVINIMPFVCFLVVVIARVIKSRSQQHSSEETGDSDATLRAKENHVTLTKVLPSDRGISIEDSEYLSAKFSSDEVELERSISAIQMKHKKFTKRNSYGIMRNEGVSL